MSIETLLNDTIRDGIEKLNGKDLGSEEYEKSVNGLTKLMDRAIELEKIEIEQQKSERDNELKQQQIKEDKTDRLVRNIISGASIIIPTVVTIWGTKASFKFEETGTVTTIMGRGFINKLLPKK